MPTQEITQDNWNDFFSTFTNQHEGWLTTLEVFAPEVGAQREAVDLPFEGISLDSEGECEAVIISIGQSPKDHVSHKIDEPKHVWVEQATSGENLALEIEAADTSKTLLRFRQPALLP